MTDQFKHLLTSQNIVRWILTVFMLGMMWREATLWVAIVITMNTLALEGVCAGLQIQAYSQIKSWAKLTALLNRIDTHDR